MMFLSLILALAHVSAALDVPQDYETALILKTYRSETQKYDQVLLIHNQAAGAWVLPGSGGATGSKSDTDGNYFNALVRRFLEETGLEKFPALKNIKYYDDKSRDNRHPIRIFEAETDVNIINKIAAVTADKPFFGTRGMNLKYQVLQSQILEQGTASPYLARAHTPGAIGGSGHPILTTHRTMLREYQGNTEVDVKDNTLESFAGATLSGTTVNKVQSEPVVEEPPIEEPAIVEGPTQAELAQQQAAALAQQQQAANANNANAGNAAKTTEGEDKKDEKKKSLAWLWITLAVVGVLAIAVTAYCCMSGDSTPEQEELV